MSYWEVARENFFKKSGSTGNFGKLFNFFSPGRVNLIGEHTDYNGGYVFPCALNLGTYGTARKRGDNVCRFASANFDLEVQARLDKISYSPSQGWANYLLGVTDRFLKSGHKLGGFEIFIHGDLPNSAGLSSSASVELLMAVALNAMFECGMASQDMAKLSQRAENEFVGVNCGIMDQFAVAMGRKNHAIMLNCAALDYEYVPLELGGSYLIITNTNKPRQLAGSVYNTRRSECESALKSLQAKLSIKALGELSAEVFEEYSGLIADETCRKRAKHIVYEDERVKTAVGLLRAGDLAGFGRLMNESHVSLRDLYEVTGYELDTLAAAAWEQDGVAGSRMTGAGFGGCTVSIVRENAAENFIGRVGEIYQRATGLKADFYVVETGGGAGVF
ncbi:MAG: galactokinase [Clostridiales bacterium]|nr:galactokinase [Clostridiales bacterium]